MKYFVPLCFLIPTLSFASLKSNQDGYVMGGTYKIGDFSFRKYNRTTAEGEQCEGFGDFISVKLPAFSIDKYEVTNVEYEQFRKATNRAKPKYSEDSRLNGERQPVVGVTLKDAEAFCKWVGKRLPNEFEWETAARGGQAEVRFPWGNSEPPSGKQTYANFFDDTKNSDGYRYSAPVGSFESGKNALGIYDMAGNVWEWTSSQFDCMLYSKVLHKEISDPFNFKSVEGNRRAVRGGSWTNSPWGARVSVRMGIPEDAHAPHLGFRCVKDNQ